VARLDELTAELGSGDQLHLSRLLRTWAPLADISFADLLLCVPDRPDGEAGYTVVGHVRPTTSRSIYRTEMVDSTFAPGERPFFDLARQTGNIIDGGLVFQGAAPRIRTLTVPVRHDGRIIAVLAREFSPDEQRLPGELETTYFFLFRRLARMIAEGAYPYDIDDPEAEDQPRVTDGLLVIDASSRVRFASPNSASVLSRVGVRQVEGQRLRVAGLSQAAVRTAFRTRLPQSEEIQFDDQTVILRCYPIIEGSELTGAMALVRDISELRRRDRLLLSKDATIAEIHHRVKNNLQTISSLLRLQGRRVVADEARQAIDESVRRIRSIAIVHEILSQEVADGVTFDEVVRPLMRLVEESLASPERPVRFELSGDAGELPSAVATALAVVLSELMQNAVEHGFASATRQDPRVIIHFAASDAGVEVSLEDNGIGVPVDFSLDTSTGLGLTIVRTLVENDLGGKITIERGAEGGTTATLVVPRAADWDAREDLASDLGRVARRVDPR
jgi:two-component system, sensor histidine kinase PdtaS